MYKSLKKALVSTTEVIHQELRMCAWGLQQKQERYTRDTNK
jgi:hypothetical protein